MNDPQLKEYLDRLVVRYERPDFIQDDPISVPHAFDDPRDQEIIGLYAALLAWGRRATIIAKMAELCERMHYRPYHFVRYFDEWRDARCLSGFVHRTFQPEDALWLTKALSEALRRYGSIETLFARHVPDGSDDVAPAIQGFSEAIMRMHPETPPRLQKHLARPSTGSACKRLNMYLRWMVRPGPVDLGIWKSLSPACLMLPLDVHCGRQARAVGLLTRRQDDWQAALELTRKCRKMNAADPARYDFAFFGAGSNAEPLVPPLADETVRRGVCSPTR